MSKMAVTSHYSVNHLAIDLISRQGSCVIHHHYFKLAISSFLTRNSRTSSPLFAYSLDFGVFLNFESSSTSTCVIILSRMWHKMFYTVGISQADICCTSVEAGLSHFKSICFTSVGSFLFRRKKERKNLSDKGKKF